MKRGHILMSEGTCSSMSFATRFDRLANACCTLLQDAGTTPEREAHIALAPLHLRNAHPETLAQYPDLFTAKASWRDRLRARLGPYILSVLAILKKQPDWMGDPLPKNADILFLSHLTDPEEASTGRDLYFGDIPAQCAAHESTRVVVALLNHTRVSPDALRMLWNATKIPRIVLGRLAGFRQEWRMAERLRQAVRNLPESRSQGELEIATFLKATPVTGRSLTALRTADQVEKLVRKLRPSLLVLTFEGHAWERLAMAAARRAHPGILCLGYHHTILFPKTAASGWKLGGGYDPDGVLTAGEVSAKWFATETALQGTPVMPLGSVRRQFEAPSVCSDFQADNLICLVAPEGILGETKRLFQAALEAAEHSPDLRLRLRLHPVLSRALVESEMPELRDLPTNVKWSVAPLEQDLALCDAVLYRGSTVALTAGLSGLRPIYLRAEEEPVCLDPLEACLGAWHNEIGSGKALSAALRRETSQQAREALQTYCQRYFTPPRASALREITELIHTSSNSTGTSHDARTSV